MISDHGLSNVDQLDLEEHLLVITLVGAFVGAPVPLPLHQDQQPVSLGENPGDVVRFEGFSSDGLFESGPNVFVTPLADVNFLWRFNEDNVGSVSVIKDLNFLIFLFCVQS